VVIIGALLTSLTAFAQNDQLRQQLLPTGKLRVGINSGNQLTRVVGRDLARELARRLGTEVVFIDYATPGLVGDAVGKELDIGFIAADPDRAKALAFTPAYVELDATYLVRGDSSIRRTADADRAGVTIATGATSAYTLFLRRELRSGRLVIMNGTEANAALQSGSVDAVAGLRDALLQSAMQVAGSRVLPDNFTRAQQAMAVPIANTAALAYLTAFLQDVARSGFVAAAVQKTGFIGASVPPVR
jgi:polar amino acid transport system substrate-binding protein